MRLAVVLLSFLVLAGCSVRSTARLSRLRAGMTKAEVVAVMGEPETTFSNAYRYTLDHPRDGKDQYVLFFEEKGYVGWLSESEIRADRRERWLASLPCPKRCAVEARDCYDHVADVSRLMAMQDGLAESGARVGAAIAGTAYVPPTPNAQRYAQSLDYRAASCRTDFDACRDACSEARAAEAEEKSDEKADRPE